MKRKSKLKRRGYACCKQSLNSHKSLKNCISTAKVKVEAKRENLKIPFPKNTCACNRSKRDEGPSDYTMYSIVNTGFFTNKGNLAASVARGFLGLYNKLAKDRVKGKALDSWEESGENLVVLEGINHKHLEFLAKDLRYAVVELFPLYKTWGRSKVMLVLTVLGREEDLEEIFDGLTYLR